MTSQDDVTRAELCEIAAMLRAREISCIELLRRMFAAVDARNPPVNAFLWQDREAAMARARELDAMSRKAADALPLYGVPLAHKDMFYCAGRGCSAGSVLMEGFVAKHTATVLERLESAGSICFGGLNMAEFAQNATGHNVHVGHCRNPWNTAFVTGGSSSGSGAAVAAGLTFGSFGSDTGGSVRLPASLCGVTGLKVTWSRVSRHGVLPMSFSFDTIGPLARSARDCAALLQCVAGRDERDPTSSHVPVPDYLCAQPSDVRGVRIGIPSNIYGGEVDPVVQRSVDGMVNVMRRRGALVTEVALPHMEAILTYGSVIPRVEAASLHAQWLRESPGKFAPHLRARLQAATDIPAVLYVEALSQRGPLLRSFVAGVFDKVDAIAFPTIRVQAPSIAQADPDTGDPQATEIASVLVEGTRPINYLGLPAISIPCGFDTNGVPIGMQLAARPFAESLLLRVADACQADTDWHRRVPG